MKTNREEHIEPGTNDDERKKLGDEFDNSKTLLDCKAKDLAYQVQIAGEEISVKRFWKVVGSIKLGRTMSSRPKRRLARPQSATLML